MKTKTYLQLSLITPYLYWALSVGVIFIWNNYSNNELPENPIANFLAYAVFFYAFGIILWGIPYTILAIGLWIWSRGKNNQKTARLFAFSPLFLALLIIIEILIFSYERADFPNGGDGLIANLGTSALGLGLLSVIYGYLFIGVAAGIYGILKRFNLLNGEESPIPLPTPGST